MQSRGLTCLDICTGIGGFTIAAEWAGFETIGFAEIEPYCCKILKQWWPKVPNIGDIDCIENFEQFRGRVTVLCGGIPCQPASLAGKRRGEKDDRWKWKTVCSLVQSVQPAWCIFENPPGILTLDEFSGVLLRLADLGYAIRLFSVPANAVGAKHLRERVFIIGNRERECGRAERAHQGSVPNFGQDQALADAAQGGVRQSGQGTRGSAVRGEASIAPDTGGEAIGERAGLREGEPGRVGRRRSGNGDTQTLADADIARSQGWDQLHQRPGQLPTWQGSQSVASDRKPQPGFRGGAHDVSDWPHPLTRERVPNRAARLKALGNACVPQQCLPFFFAIAEVERCHVNESKPD